MWEKNYQLLSNSCSYSAYPISSHTDLYVHILCTYTYIWASLKAVENATEQLLSLFFFFGFNLFLKSLFKAYPPMSSHLEIGSQHFLILLQYRSHCVCIGRLCRMVVGKFEAWCLQGFRDLGMRLNEHLYDVMHVACMCACALNAIYDVHVAGNFDRRKFHQSCYLLSSAKVIFWNFFILWQVDDYIEDMGPLPQ